ncbi:hypothetical protein [Stieleria neptunia]|uniref:hypothetical protein n=1 Tax=Stieleria neptunia TaxID=2527979 RepID=UPI0011A3A316|nr:hypothetical protein [Stieleria neptunia]
MTQSLAAGREPSGVLAKMRNRRARALPLTAQETDGKNASQRCPTPSRRDTAGGLAIGQPIQGDSGPTAANQPVAAPPPLFRLRTLRKTIAAVESRPVTLQLRRRSTADDGPGAADQNELLLRIDPPEPPPAPPSADRITPAKALPAGCAKDLFSDHTGDLIASLSQWSLRLDRREAELDRRERELNQRLRLLRQHQFAD